MHASLSRCWLAGSGWVPARAAARRKPGRAHQPSGFEQCSSKPSCAVFYPPFARGECVRMCVAQHPPSHMTHSSDRRTMLLASWFRTLSQGPGSSGPPKAYLQRQFAIFNAGTLHNTSHFSMIRVFLVRDRTIGTARRACDTGLSYTCSTTAKQSRRSLERGLDPDHHHDDRRRRQSTPTHVPAHDLQRIIRHDSAVMLSWPIEARALPTQQDHPVISRPASVHREGQHA
jgi:hypothetical protein